MSKATADTLDEAIRAHISDESGGDLVVGWLMCAGVVEHDSDAKTSWLTTRSLAEYEVRGLLRHTEQLLNRVPTDSDE